MIYSFNLINTGEAKRSMRYYMLRCTACQMFIEFEFLQLLGFFFSFYSFYLLLPKTLIHFDAKRTNQTFHQAHLESSYVRFFF